ncbi:MAG: c-type cytochrome [Gammaproteobacteria bacterium]|nr:c-type cytochrome [Gammaproteobacteria bacterium]
MLIRILIAALVLALGAFGGLYCLSEAKLRDVQADPPFVYPVTINDTSIERGRYLARTRGCFGCHGQQLEGKNFADQWDWPVRAIAPNLAEYARDHDDATLEAAIRQGIAASGRALVSMPSYNFSRLSDANTAALIAFLRSAPIVANELPTPRLGWRARWEVAFGGYRHMEDWADAVPQLRIDPHAEPDRARGEYLGMTLCNECHGLDLRGANLFGEPTPDLAIVSTISREQFQNIIRTGTGRGDRQLGLMTLVASNRYPFLTATDIDDLYPHLTTLAGEPVPEDVFWRP